MIELQSVSRAWGDFSLAVSLSVARREYLVILGPSGCGKSLLLGTVAGIFRPEGGRVILGGEDMTHRPPEDHEVGFVFQKSSLFPHMSVSGNIEFGLRTRGESRTARRARVEELEASLALGPLMNRPVSTLSGGEAQKVAIARALAPRPKILLLDEPLSLVDHNARLELQGELIRLHESTGITALHVTHNRDEAKVLGSRCAVMLGGSIVQEGTKKQIFAEPRCLFVARFLGLGDKNPPAPGCSESCLAGAGRCDIPFSSEADDA